MEDQKKPFIIKTKGIVSSDKESQKPSFLRIRDGMIHSISADMPNVAGDEIIDFSDLTLSPCFCDYHLHFSGQAKNTAASIGESLLRHGIAHAYEGGDKGLSGLSFRETLKGMTKIMTSGYALYKRGGYGGAIGRSVDGPSDALLAIDELDACHVDYIKIVNSGLYEPESDRISKGGFESSELLRIVEYAGERGLEVYCHANGEEAVEAAVDAGVSAIVHGLYTRDETFTAMAEKNVAFIPTLRAFQGLQAVSKTGTARQNIEKTVEGHLSALNRAFSHKVRVLPGSDSGPGFIPYGSAYIEELGMFLRAGIPFKDMIRSAAAEILIEGGPADFLLLDGLSVEHVVLRGQFLL